VFGTCVCFFLSSLIQKNTILFYIRYEMHGSLFFMSMVSTVHNYNITKCTILTNYNYDHPSFGSVKPFTQQHIVIKFYSEISVFIFTNRKFTSVIYSLQVKLHLSFTPLKCLNLFINTWIL